MRGLHNFSTNKAKFEQEQELEQGKEQEEEQPFNGS